MSQADSRAGEQSLDLSSYNSSYKDVASLDKAQQHPQRELDAMAERLRDSESERERLRAELEMERERERAVASTSAGEEPAEPETPSAAGDAAGDSTGDSPGNTPGDAAGNAPERETTLDSPIMKLFNESTQVT